MNLVSSSSFRPCAQSAFVERRGYTLVEILVATTILGLAVSMAMVVFIAALKRAQHTEVALKGTEELRYATDMISQAVRSAAQLPTVAGSGLQLIVPPKDLGYAVVQDTTWLDGAHTVSGSKSNQRMLHVSNFTQPSVVTSAWLNTGRPSGAIATADIATYFIGTANLPTTDLRDIFSVGDTITIPATAYGAQTTGVINSISNNANNKTLTLTNNLGVDVPNGTKIAATSGRRIMFEVTAAGDLRYYPDNRDLTRFRVLAHDIDPSPLSDPAVSTSTTTLPFVIPSSSTDYVIVNLQKVPAGTRVGRTLQGVRTTVYARTDPLSQ